MTESSQYWISSMINLHEEILDFVAHVSPTSDEISMRAEIVKRVEDAVLAIWNRAVVHVTGSYGTGLCLPDSDIDLVVEGRAQSDATFGEGDELDQLADMLVERGVAERNQIRVIRSAKIPILKFVDSTTNIGVDVAFDVEGSSATSAMIRLAVEQHASLRPLVMVIKTFLKQRNLNELFRGGLSSYGLVLMVIHYLQLYAVTPVRRQELEDCTLGYEVQRFFEVFGVTFDYSNVICVTENGWTVPKRSLGWEEYHNRATFAIADPLFPHRNVGEGTYLHTVIRQSFADASAALACKPDAMAPTLSNILSNTAYEGLDNKRRCALSRWRLSTVLQKRSSKRRAVARNPGATILTYMLRNIPNKYTRDLLLRDIDLEFKGTYDFFYLPIDFKMHCNKGYAFINFDSADAAAAFVKAFQGRAWTLFNSDKIGAVSAAHIQGQAQLVQHFQVSSVMQEDESVQPVMFYTDGPLKGQRKPFPASVPRTGTTPSRESQHQHSHHDDHHASQDHDEGEATADAEADDAAIAAALHCDDDCGAGDKLALRHGGSAGATGCRGCGAARLTDGPLADALAGILRRCDWADIVEREATVEPSREGGRRSWSTVAAAAGAGASASGTTASPTVSHTPTKRHERAPSTATATTPPPPSKSMSGAPLSTDTKKPRAKRIRRTRADQEEDEVEMSMPPLTPQTARVARGWVRNSGSGSGSDGGFGSSISGWRIVTSSKRRRWRSVPVPAPVTPPTTPTRGLSSKVQPLTPTRSASGSRVAALLSSVTNNNTTGAKVVPLTKITLKADAAPIARAADKKDEQFSARWLLPATAKWADV